MSETIDSYGDNPTRGFRGPGPGTMLGVYRLEEPLGRGGMGQVWKAWDTAGERVVAVKLLPPEFRGNPEAIAQVRDAFRVVHALTHQHIGKTIGMFDQEPHGPHVVLEYLPGVPLSKFARTHREEVGPLTVELVAKLLRPVAQALDFAHAEGVLHRDVKPENILVEAKEGTAGKVWLIDFGLAAEIRHSMTRHTNKAVDTRGTRPYMSPEQLKGKRHQWDGRTDQYALAVVAYELLAGQLPFDGEDDMAQMLAILQEPVDAVPTLPLEVNAALLRGLAKSRDERFATCAEFTESLVASQTPLPRPVVAPAESRPAAVPPIVVKEETPLTAPPPTTPPWIVVKDKSQPTTPPPLKAPFSAEQARAGQVAWAKFLGKPVVEQNSIGLELTLIPPGEFPMGSSDADVAAALAADAAMKTEYMNDERPQHGVRLTQPFRLGTHPVLQREFQQVLGRNPSHFSPSGDAKAKVERVDFLRLPVEQVSWFDAVEFCNQLSERELLPPYYELQNIQRDSGAIKSAEVKVSGGSGYRLPTEAEWEYACRAGTTSAYHFGNVNNGKEANVDGNSPYGTTTKGPYLQRTSVVGSYPANGFGLYDLHGNVWEWCGDWYDAGFYGQTPGAAIDPFNERPADCRVLRGGSWGDDARCTRSADRSRLSPDFRNYGVIGLRLARTE